MMFRSPRDVGLRPAPKVYRKYDLNETIELYGCDICTDGGWTSETEVEIHRTKVHYEKNFMNEIRKRDDYCFICIKKCPNKESVIKHIKTEHLLSTETCQRVEREIFICNDCSAIFFNKQNLYIHLRYAHVDMNNIQLIRCVLCMKEVQVRSMLAHFYLHNIQSVSTCRICLCKNKNTKALAEHLKTHPYYLKCDICCYETSRVETFHNHILLRHKNSVKVNNSTTDDNDTDISLESDKNLITGDQKTDSLVMIDDGDDTLIDRDFITVIEISDMDTVTDNTSTILMKDTKINKNKLKGIKKKGKKKKKITTESATAVENLLKDCAMDGTNLTENDEKDFDKDLITLKCDDSLISVEDLMPVQVKDNPDSENNLVTLFDINGTEMGNFAITNNYLMADDVIKNESTNTDLMIDEVMSDSNLMTVIEISDQDVTATDTAANTNLTENVKTAKDFVINDSTITEVNVAADSHLTDNINPVKDFVSNDITATAVNIECDTNLTDNVKPIKDLKSNVVILTKANTDNVVTNPVKDSDDFKRFFIPDAPSFLRLQRIAGIRGIRLSNEVHICVLCREICVGFDEMRSHVDEHTVIVEKSISYECSCGEQFTNKVMLKYHAFKTKHVIK